MGGMKVVEEQEKETTRERIALDKEQVKSDIRGCLALIGVDAKTIGFVMSGLDVCFAQGELAGAIMVQEAFTKAIKK